MDFTQATSAPWPASAAAAVSPQNALSFGHVVAHADIGAFRVCVALLICLGLGIALILALRRFGYRTLGSASGTPRRLKLIETVRLNPKSALYLIECDGSAVLLAADETGIKTLHVTGALQQEGAA